MYGGYGSTFWWMKHTMQSRFIVDMIRSCKNRPSDRRLSAKLVPTFAGRGCCMVSATNSHGRYLGFLCRIRYFFIQVAPQLSSRGWVDPVPDPLLLRKSGRAGHRTWDLWICSQKLWPLDHRGGQDYLLTHGKLQRTYFKIWIGTTPNCSSPVYSCCMFVYVRWMTSCLRIHWADYVLYHDRFPVVTV
jgi:hypothetical protein